MTTLPFSRSCHHSLLHFQLTRKCSCCCGLTPFSLASRIILSSVSLHSRVAAGRIGKDYPRGCRERKQSSMHPCPGELCLPLPASNFLVGSIFLQIMSNSKGFMSVNGHGDIEPQEERHKWREGVFLEEGKVPIKEI